MHCRRGYVDFYPVHWVQRFNTYNAYRQTIRTFLFCLVDDRLADLEQAVATLNSHLKTALEERNSARLELHNAEREVRYFLHVHQLHLRIFSATVSALDNSKQVTPL